MRDACPPVTGHRRDQLAQQMVPEAQCNGRLACWPAREFALGTTSIATRGITSGPWHRATTQLRRAVCGNVYFDSLGAISSGPADLHGYTATCVFGGRESRMTPVLGGSCHQFCPDTHHPEPLLREGGGNALFRHQIILWLRAGGLAHWTPTGWIHPQVIAGVGGSSCRMLSHWT
jgi:hypothetical protein